MDEIFVYSLYKNILSASQVIQGRFVVMDGPVGDLSAANFGQVVKDTLDGLALAVKYPAVIMLPPINILSEPRKAGWEVMKNDMLFVTMDGRNGDGSQKSSNHTLNISEHYPRYDWKDMKECASNFIAQLDKTVTSNKNVLSSFRLRSSQQIFFRRLSLATSEGLNGIRVSFDTMMYTACELTDYAPDAAIVIPPLNQHPLHTH